MHPNGVSHSPSNRTWKAGGDHALAVVCTESQGRAAALLPCATDRSARGVRTHQSAHDPRPCWLVPLLMEDSYLVSGRGLFEPAGWGKSVVVGRGRLGGALLVWWPSKLDYQNNVPRTRRTLIVRR